MSRAVRTEVDLQRRQRQGTLRVCTAAVFRQRVAELGLEQAYAATDVVVAADASFIDQGCLLLGLGPTDPPIRIREAQVDGVAALAGAGPGELLLPIAAGGAQVLANLLAGQRVSLAATGEATPLQPRPELHTSLDLDRIGVARLSLHRAISENGVVAVSSAEGLIRSPYGPLLGPFGNALFSCGGAGSIGLTMPGLAGLGPGSPVLVAGGLGVVVGAGSGHQPRPRRQASGHARTPGAVAAVSVDLADLDLRWLRASHFEGQGSALLVALAAPVPLLSEAVARRAAAPHEQLEAPVLDLSIPRRIKPSFGGVPYAQLLAGRVQVSGRSLRCAPAHSIRLAAEIGEELVQRLQEGRFPLRLPLHPLTERAALLPLDP
ncbi:homocysteine biosynthesis protein [Synechococcus sp. CCY9202]|uniref:homocysteine biosynthesis protein n=1 Tax=Synechococcus sp. CCY9202 TaxID=174698 RepID=UPI002B204916|nr:homocysteine biosynthesis protein [Synechococcus sp. CCY9202]MEA5422328.1 homocysteine biosynthesis protein [Synechococcus sp. CCY9202]